MALTRSASEEREPVSSLALRVGMAQLFDTNPKRKRGRGFSPSVLAKVRFFQEFNINLASLRH